MNDEPREAPATSGLARLIALLQYAAFGVVGLWLFASMLTVPLHAAYAGGLLGAWGVFWASLALVFVAGQFCAVRSSAFLAAQLGLSEPGAQKRRDTWARFVLFVLFLACINWFAANIRQPGHWGVVAGHDQPQYYAYLHSWVFDQDLDFENELRAIPGAWDMMAANHPDRPEYNVAPVGAPVLWLPFYLLAHGLLTGLHAADPGVSLDGIGAPYAMSAAFASILMAWLGMVMIFSTLRACFSTRAALFSVLFLGLASPLLYYVADLPWMSHAPSFFGAAFALWTWQRHRAKPTWTRAAMLGAAIGVAMLVRPSHAVLLLLPVANAVTCMATERRWRRPALDTLLSFACALVVFVPQLLTWRVRYGIEPPPGSPMNWASPALLRVLFAAHHGACAWHPALLAGFLGVPLLWKRSRSLTLTLALLLLTYVYITAAIEAWHAGGSFGMRRFVGVLPFLSFGIAAFGVWVIGQFRKRPGLAALLVLFAAFVYNHTLMIQAREAWTPFLPPVSFQQVWASNATVFHERYGNPFTYPLNLPLALKHGVRPGQLDVVTGMPSTPEIDVTDVDLLSYLGRGWHASMRHTATLPGCFLARDKDCTLLLNLWKGPEYLVDVVLAPARGLPEGQDVGITFNGKRMGSQHLPVNKRTGLSLRLPADAVRDGINVVGLTFAQQVERKRSPSTGDRPRGLPVPSQKPRTVTAEIWRIRVRYAGK